MLYTSCPTQCDVENDDDLDTVIHIGSLRKLGAEEVLLSGELYYSGTKVRKNP